jgi:hypothetical protein
MATAMRMKDEWNQTYKKQRLNPDYPTARWLQDPITGTLKEVQSNDQDDEQWDPTTTMPWQRDNKPDPKSAVIVDSILLAAANATTIFFYLSCVLTILKLYRVTVKLRKTPFYPKRAEFVGANVLKYGNFPAESKNEAITNLQRPIMFTDL